MAFCCLDSTEMGIRFGDVSSAAFGTTHLEDAVLVRRLDVVLILVSLWLDATTSENVASASSRCQLYQEEI
jgi:hypothetical protein